MDKKALRIQYQKKRQELSENQRDKMSMDIANRLLTMPIWDKSHYHIFMPIERFSEVDTNYIINILHGKDKNIILPKTDIKNHYLKNILLTDQTLLKKNSWGIIEPTSGIEVPENMIEVVFVPLLAFDKKGNRVGYGKGFYDGFLQKCLKDTLKIGLSFFSAEEIIKDIQPNDIPLNYCVTPNKIYYFERVS